jgi:signal-transduction protein with cAMP-binding, CBS, and nucleotidyltransferase domain
MLKRTGDNITMMTITVGDLMRKKVDTIEGTASIQETAKKMKDKKVSSLLVLDIDGKPIGLVTERDLVRKACINDVRTSEVTNQAIMSSPLITIDSNSSPSTAADMMLRNNVRHLLVIDDKSVDIGKHIGMITPLDFTKYQEYTRDGEHKDAIEEILEYYI